MVSGATSIPNIRYHRMTQVYFRIERVVVRILGRQMAGQAAQICPPCGGQAVGVKGYDRVGICRIAEDVRGTARNRVDNIRVDLGRALAGLGEIVGARRVAIIIVSSGDLLLVVVKSIAATNDDLVIVGTRTPVKADLGSEVELLRCPGANARVDG